MATAFGHQAFIGFEEESTFGTYASAGTFLRILNESIKPVYGRNPKPSLGSVGIRQHHAMRQSVEGSITFQLPVTGAELLFKHALGQLGTSGTASPYTHNIIIGDDLPTGLSFYVDRDQGAIGGSSAFRYSGCQINKLTLTQGPDEIAQCTIDIVGQKQALGAAESPTYLTDVLYDYSNVTTCTFAGTGISIVDYELTIENNLNTDRYYLGSTTRHGFGRNGNVKITGKFTAEFDSTTFTGVYADWLAQTAGTHLIKWTNGSNTLTIQNQGNSAYLNAGAPEAGGPGIINLPIEFEMFVDQSDTYDQIDVDFVNSTATP